jgi:ABC-type branched-subunit amino acid transport system substrate-binding protein
MANEGIMAMPQGMGMQGEQAQQEQPTVTSADSYDAAMAALGMVNPDGQEALKAAIRENLADEQLSPQELQTFIITFEELSQDPAGYKAARQQLIDNDYVDP